ncbi:nitrous oxide-stimulated promoter family protein [Treponema sp. OMZ 840]|uniref:nitrous oxide-stimulated promoter family protein n=1 Tax=Treponema sp. OMZ 840 TaxID=244313 RepID=UPI003D8FCB33
MSNLSEAKKTHEKKIVGQMISLYCRKKHGAERNLCAECAELYAYTQTKTDACPFIKNKTFCSACKIHCYSPEMRRKIKAVMRFSGPRMLLYHPFLVIKHIMVSITLKGKK